MLAKDEQGLRSRTTGLVLDWAQGREPPFTGADRHEFAEVIEAAHVVADEARAALHRWVDAGRRAGMSWAEVGDTLGITKQAAQQRFRSTADADGTMGGEELIEVRVGATAFNEMRMLRDEGAKGNELMATGALRLTFRRTDRLWEYRREIGVGPPIDRLARDGWVHVSSWFPFHYFKRSLDVTG